VIEVAILRRELVVGIELLLVDLGSKLPLNNLLRIVIPVENVVSLLDTGCSAAGGVVWGEPGDTGQLFLEELSGAVILVNRAHQF